MVRLGEGTQARSSPGAAVLSLRLTQEDPDDERHVLPGAQVLQPGTQRMREGAVAKPGLRQDPASRVPTGKPQRCPQRRGCERALPLACRRSRGGEP